MQITNNSPVLPVYHTPLSPIYGISYEPAVYIKPYWTQKVKCIILRQTV